MNGESIISSLPKEREKYPQINIRLIDEGIEEPNKSVEKSLPEYFKQEDVSMVNMDSFRALVDTNKFPMKQEKSTINIIEGQETAKFKLKIQERWEGIIKRVIFKNKFKDLHIDIKAARNICQRNPECHIRKKPKKIIIASCVSIFYIL